MSNTPKDIWAGKDKSGTVFIYKDAEPVWHESGQFLNKGLCVAKVRGNNLPMEVGELAHYKLVKVTNKK